MISLSTGAAHESRLRAALAAVLLEAGAVMATLRWEPADDTLRSLLFLSACVVAALFTGLAVTSASRYLAWMDERARRLAVERDQQAAIAAASERTRIARELHDIVSHSLSVVITLADAASVVSCGDPGRAAMTEVADAGRQALSDMRAMLGVPPPTASRYPSSRGLPSGSEMSSRSWPTASPTARSQPPCSCPRPRSGRTSGGSWPSSGSVTRYRSWSSPTRLA
jgi:hypothetical protein